MSQTFKVFEVATDGLSVSVGLNDRFPNTFMCVYACDADGNAPANTDGITGTVALTVETTTCPYPQVVPSGINMAAPEDASVQASAKTLFVDITGEAGFTHYAVACHQYEG